MKASEVLSILAGGASAIGSVAPGAYGLAARLGAVALELAAGLAKDEPASITRIRTADELLTAAAKRRAKKGPSNDGWYDELGGW